MKYFTKIRIAWIIVILLTAVNVTMITLSIFSPSVSNTSNNDDGRRKSRFKKECMLRSSLKLSELQTAKYDSIKDIHHQKASPIVDTLRISRSALMAELKHNPVNQDLINAMVKKVNALNNQLFELSIVQYLEIKLILDSTQQESLSNVYCDMFGCSKHHNRNNKFDSENSHKCTNAKGCE